MKREIEPPYFVNQADTLKAQRTQRAINAEIAIGGKFFCWHDWTYISECMPKTAFEAGTALLWFKYLCTKCGKETRMNSAESLGYIENLFD